MSNVPPHPITLAEVTLILGASTVDKIFDGDDIQIHTAREYLGSTVLVHGAWPYPSDYKEGDDYAYVLVEGEHSETYSLITIGGNASEQVLYLMNRKLLPSWRTLSSIEVNGHDLYYWEKVQT